MAFNEMKLTELAAGFLKLAGNRMKYIHLIKLLYLLDRESIQENGFPVTTDRHVSMKHGPVLSRCLDFIRRPEVYPDGFWGKHIETDPISFDVLLVNEPPESHISQWIEEKIKAIFDEYARLDRWDLIDHMHEKFSEWKDPGKSSRPISYEDILRAVGHNEERIQFFLAEEECYDELDRLLA